MLNDSRGVVVEVEGAPDEIQLFLERLPAEPPPLSSTERMSVAEVPFTAGAGFDILNSERGQPPSALVAPDTATCIACLAELFDPSDRRYRYPFINCTDCGPRFTIVRGIPYDRPLTTMAGFRMCDRCRTEYDDPLDRRFHAQPNACPACGPQAGLVDAEDRPVAAEGDPVAAAEEALLQGSIVAVKGVGGFHLACRADHEAAVARLRGRKHREDRPFALMVPELAAARALIEMDQAEAALLGSPERPIVLARRRPGASVAPVATVSARFHNGIAEGTARICVREAERRGVSTVVLSGGVFQNALLLERTSALLARAGLHVLVPRLLPSNDGGISYGQAAVASAVLSAE